MRVFKLIAAGVLALPLMVAAAHADWLDDVTDSVKDGLNKAGDSIDKTLGEGRSDENAGDDAETPEQGSASDTEAGSPERVKEPTDPKLRRVQDVEPVNRVAHSTVDGLRVRSLPGTDTAVAGSIGENEVVRVTGEVPGTYSGYRWVRVRFPDGSFAYAARKFMENGRPEPEDPTRTASTGAGEPSGGEPETGGDASNASGSADVSERAEDQPSGNETERRKTARSETGDGNKGSSDKPGKSGGAPKSDGPRDATATANAAGGDDGPPPIGYGNLLDAYLDANADVVGQQDFRDAYARRYLCDALERVSEDEFLSRDLVLTKAGEEAEKRASGNRTFRMRVGTVAFGQYKPDKKAFPVVWQQREEMPEEASFTLSGENSYCDHGTKVSYTVPDPENPVWPNRFDIDIAGLDAIQWLEIPVDQARKLVQKRKSEVDGSVDRGAILAFTIEAEEGPAKPAKPDMLGRSDARHEELVSAVSARVTSAKLIGEDGRVLQKWGAETFESAASDGDGESGTGPRPPFAPDQARYTMAYHTLLSSGSPDLEEIASNSQQAKDINEFERAEMIDRLAKKLSEVPMPTAAYTVSAFEPIGEYDFGKKAFLLGEEHTGTNWRGLISNVQTTIDGTEVLVTPVEGFDPQSIAMPAKEARKKLEAAELLNKDPRNRLADFRITLKPVSVSENEKVERPWAKKEVAGNLISDGAWEGPVMRVEVQKMEVSEKPVMGERVNLFTWTPEGS